MMVKNSEALMGTFFVLFATAVSVLDMYQDGWVDRNKNDKMDPY